MHKLIMYCCLCGFIAMIYADAMIGPGKWNLLKIAKKEADINKFEFNIRQRKYNRSHDIFQGSFRFHEELSDLYGVRLDICKHVDGGCKQYQVLTDDSFGNMIGKYASNNFHEMLGSAGCENCTIPIPPGTYEIEQYAWDWTSLPNECPYGDYIAECCVMEKALTVGCLVLQIEFVETEDDDADDEEEK